MTLSRTATLYKVGQTERVCLIFITMHKETMLYIEHIIVKALKFFLCNRIKKWF